MKKFLFPKSRWHGESKQPACSFGQGHFYLPRHFAMFFLLALLPFAAKVSAQNDTPCECSQRWTEAAAWNPNGTVNDSPPANYQPKGIVKCGAAAETQANIMTEFGCVYNPATFPINVMTCNDPITGLPIPSPVGPTTGAPIIFFNFDVRPNSGGFQMQINSISLKSL